MPKYLVIVLLVCFIIYPLVAEAVDDTFAYPDSPAGKIAQQFLQVLNSGDEDCIREFTLNHRSTSSLAKRPLEARIAMMVQLHNQVGVLAPVLVTEEDERLLAITVQSQTLNIWLSVRFELDKNEPDKLSTMSMQPTSPPNMKMPDDIKWKNLTELLTIVQKDSSIPAIAAAIVVDGSIADKAAIGIRQAGGKDSVTIDDRFHIGSITKSITAGMIGRLVELEVLTWETTISELLPDANARHEYQDVTLEQLLQHRSGLPAYLQFDDEEMNRLFASASTTTERRKFFSAEVLQDEPVNAPGSTMSYSNAGYVVAGYMAERAGGRSWESLIKEYIFEPCGMNHSGFGWPATKTSLEQPRGHFHENDQFRPQGIEEYVLGDFLAPAGDVHASIGDLARYAISHLSGLLGRDAVLSSRTIQRLHTPPAKTGSDHQETDGDLYACGWVISHWNEFGARHWHEGSAGTFFASIELYPQQNRAIVIAMNVGVEGASISKRICELITERWSREAE